MSVLSLNQVTLNRLSIAETIDACSAAGVDSIALWREKIAEIGLLEAARLVEESGLRVSSLCRGGFFTAENASADNRSAVDEAAAVGAEILVLLAGGLPTGSRDLEAARAQVAQGLDELAPYAADRGVRLGIEPLHPMYCADRSVVCTLAQALDLAEKFPAKQVGVVIDTYHVWWDATVYDTVRRAAGRIAGFHINDWGVPLPAGALLGRRLPGDGCIDITRLAQAVFETGFDGPVEVEVLNEEIWDAPAAETLASIVGYSEPLLALARAAAHAVA